MRGSPSNEETNLFSPGATRFLDFDAFALVYMKNDHVLDITEYPPLMSIPAFVLNVVYPYK